MYSDFSENADMTITVVGKTGIRALFGTRRCGYYTIYSVFRTFLVTLSKSLTFFCTFASFFSHKVETPGFSRAAEAESTEKFPET